MMFIGRFTPLIRIVFPYSAGVAEMPFGRCIAFSALGSIGWITGLALLGRAVGSQWPTWRHHLDYVDYVGAGDSDRRDRVSDLPPRSARALRSR